MGSQKDKQNVRSGNNFKSYHTYKCNFGDPPQETSHLDRHRRIHESLQSSADKGDCTLHGHLHMGFVLWNMN